MFKFVHKVFYNCTENKRDGYEFFSTCDSFNQTLKAQLRAEIQDDDPIIVINNKAQLPPHWQARLLQPFLENQTTQCTSALNTSDYQLSPITHDFRGSLTDLDNTIYLLQEPKYFQSNSLNPHCFAIKNINCLDLELERYAVNNLVVDEALNGEKIVAPTFPDIGDQHPLPAHPLATLHLKLETVDISPKKLSYPIFDKKPVALHVVMDWGGGVHQWVNDFIQNHSELNHLVLLSHGEFYRQQHGEQYTLHWQGTGGLCLDQFHLAAPISSTTIHHTQYQSILSSLEKRWGVKLMVISSLIGHAMDCLNTGLPTLRVLHDYFPHWPLLNAQLDTDVVSKQDIDSALEASLNEPFGQINATQLEQWQTKQAELLAQNNISIVAPDVSVKENLLKLPRAEVFAKTTIIPHAAKTLEAIDYKASANPFTVLVLGRISQPKGQDLIKECIEFFHDNSGFRFVLLGAGVNGKCFEAYSNTDVMKNYDIQELTQILNTVSPQLALLASETSETFSYTLSELQMSGIPVVATNRGAFRNRILNGKTGLLVEPKTKLITQQILSLKEKPEQLKQLHRAALTTKQTTREENKSLYQKLFKFDKLDNKYTTNGLLSPLPVVKHLQTAKANNAILRTEVRATTVDLKEKTAWAKELTSQVQHLEKNLELERHEVKHLKTSFHSQAQQYNEKITELGVQNSEIQSHLEKLNSEIVALHQIRDQLATQKTQLATDKEKVETNLKKAQHGLEVALNQIEQMKNSRSWRFTKPLRRFTTYTRHKRNALRFRYSQIKGLPKRVVNSLRSRGFKQTVLIAKNKLKKPEVSEAPQAHEVVDVFDAITIPKHAQPKASIIIPVFNQFKHTYHCLESIARLADETPFEVIVIDDCSNDETEQAIKNISGINYHRQAENGGFIESCNTGASMAKSEFLVFLNNDTEVLNGWLDNLIQTFATQSEAGLVGSQLLYPDGRLQEAGGIVFNDGSGWNYGRLENPEVPEYQHLREVTYISGASIMVRKELFEHLGQFDQRYKPAYYEDTDLAFAVRKAGLKVYYQPLSKVIHFEGISSGTDLSSGTKKYQVINQQKFLDKWQQELQQQPAPGSDIELARFQNKPSRVLIFDACTPTPDQDSGSLRMLNLMKIFIELGHQVSFVPENMAHFEHYTHDLQKLGINCVYAPKYSSPVEYLKAKGGYYDIIILSRYYVAEPLMPILQSYCTDAKVWFDTVDLHYLRETRMAELESDGAALKAAEKTKIKELQIAEGCDLTLVVSPYEQQVLAEEKPALNVAVLSNIHEIHGGHAGYANSKDLLFIGGYQHTPNVDGLMWFVEEAFPQIINALPDIKLHVVGSKAPPQIVALGDHPNIVFHGFVEDIEPMMRNVRIAVAPLRFGAGVKGKVNMSMSYGQPVVGTKVAVEGMYTEHRKDVIMADDAETFAEEVIALYQNAPLWHQVSQGGIDNVKKWFSFNAAKNVITKLVSP